MLFMGVGIDIGTDIGVETSVEIGVSIGVEIGVGDSRGGVMLSTDDVFTLKVRVINAVELSQEGSDSIVLL